MFYNHTSRGNNNFWPPSDFSYFCLVEKDSIVLVVTIDSDVSVQLSPNLNHIDDERLKIWAFFCINYYKY